MNDRPTAEELLEAVAKFLSEEAVPALDGHPKYQARVAANVARIVARELATEDEHLRGEWTRLCDLLGDAAPLPEARDARRAALVAKNEALVRRIRAGDADSGAWRRAVLAHLRRTTDEKLAVSQGPARPRTGPR